MVTRLARHYILSNSLCYTVLCTLCIWLSGVSTEIVIGQNETKVHLMFSKSELKTVVGDVKDLQLTLNDTIASNATLAFTYQIGDTISSVEKDHYIEPIPDIFIVANQTKSISFNITSTGVGHFNLGVNSSSKQFTKLSEQFVRITIVHSSALVVINSVIGWIYFVAWSVSFYPQVYENWRRKSVVGLNFDFLLYNITGFLAYGFFNVGMYWVNDVKEEYMNKHPRGINPVQLNDVIFTLHAVFVTAVTIFQCFVYDRGGQKISKICITLVSLAWLFIVVALFIVIFGDDIITWLQYLYYFSYVKLGVTIIKYIPQAWMNCKRRSTLGWSIGNVLLDFTGGSFSLLQMFLLAYNNDDWSSIFGDPTKFGLGAFSILFDILFMVQHYCLFRGRDPYESLNNYEEVYSPLIK
ncbi:cystinosin-like [Saccostrea echinata]|uniref:cystinosin-like n=1 Tax=Saccostrea echinata TaxID=191078 RepID=UPI002A81306E|nr:cystinosin-like [Saccostrea echinata]